MNNRMHKRLFPILYTILWGTSILFCSCELSFNSLDLPIDKKLAGGICIIYVTFLFECLISLCDFASVHKREQFNIRFIFWLIKFVANVAATLVFAILFLENTWQPEFVTFILFALICWLKYINVSLNNNIEDYMGPIQLETYISTFKE